MAWDERLFQLALDSVNRLKEKLWSKSTAENSVCLSEVSNRLAIIASAICGRKIEVKEAESYGGVRGEIFFLPSRVSMTKDRYQNIQIYLYRTVFMSALWTIRNVVDGDLKSLTDSEDSISVVAGVLKWIDQDMPAFKDQFISLLDGLKNEDESIPSWINDLKKEMAESNSTLRWTGVQEEFNQNHRKNFSRKIEDRQFNLLFGNLSVEVLKKPSNDFERPELFSKDSFSKGTEIRGKAKENVERVNLTKDRLDENPLVHVFEKVQTADEYGGGKKALDGSDEIEEHAQALSELNLRHVIRTNERSDSVFRSDVVMDNAAADLECDLPERAPFTYDEWDGRKRVYRKDWCHVYAAPVCFEGAPSSQGLADLRERNQKQVKKLKKVINQILNQRTWRGRQPEGDEFDLEAVVERSCDMFAGRTPSDKVYSQRKQTHRDLKTLILLDLSLSSDSWVEGHRVLDVTRDAVYILGEVMGFAEKQFSIAGFCSNTRLDCRFQIIKDFDESWSVSRHRLLNLQPSGFTRIGPAIRHSVSVLEGVASRQKLIILISDGKPNDFDRYEGRYGEQDVRQAIREARSKDINIHSLAIDSKAKFYFAHMFGKGQYQILPRPELLATSLTNIYRDLLMQGHFK